MAAAPAPLDEERGTLHAEAPVRLARAALLLAEQRLPEAEALCREELKASLEAHGYAGAETVVAMLDAGEALLASGDPQAAAGPLGDAFIHAGKAEGWASGEAKAAVQKRVSRMRERRSNPGADLAQLKDGVVCSLRWYDELHQFHLLRPSAATTPREHLRRLVAREGLARDTATLEHSASANARRRPGRRRKRCI